VAKAIKSTSGALLIGIHDARQSNPDQINPPDGTTVDDDVELIYLAESAGLCSRPKT
jgi:hypothetical protein